MDETERELVNTTDIVVQVGNTDTETKPNVMKESITPPIVKKKIDTVTKTEKWQASNKTVDTPSRNKYYKGI